MWTWAYDAARAARSGRRHENEELIRLGAYRKGTAAHVDEAVDKYPKLKEFLCQPVEEPTDFTESVAWMGGILGGDTGPNE